MRQTKSLLIQNARPHANRTGNSKELRHYIVFSHLSQKADGISGEGIAFYIVIEDRNMPSQKLPTFKVEIIV